MCAADIKPEEVEWLWRERLPLGKCVIVAGEGGLGKSMVAAWIAATVSRGGEWPCGEGRSPLGSTIILTAEDGLADTLVPRLEAAGADRSKIHFASAVRVEDAGHRSFNLQRDLPELEKKIDELGDVLVVIIDPIASYLGKVDSHKNAELRAVLEPLGEMAARLRVTIIANTHLSKAAGGSANNRVIGSVAFVNHARAAFIVTKDPGDIGRRLFLPSKTNLGRAREGLAYRIADTCVGAGNGATPFMAPYVKWEESTVSMSADEAVAAMAEGAEGKSAKAEAIEFLRDELAEGPKPAAEARRAATNAGHTAKAIRMAREALGIKAQKASMQGGWVWALPKMPSFTSEDAPKKNWAPSGPFEESGTSPGAFGKTGRCPEDAQSRERAPSDGDHAPSSDDLGERPTDDLREGATDEFPDLPDFLDRRAVVPKVGSHS